MRFCPKCARPYGVRARCYACEVISRWTPKPYFDKTSGYLRIRLPNRGGQAFFHRWLMGQELGRDIIWPEVVHHINGNKLDNRISNLELTTASEHMSHHKKGANKAKLGWSHKYRCCISCATTNIKHKARGQCVKCYMKIYDSNRVHKSRTSCN